jgi:hypothetical protein
MQTRTGSSVVEVIVGLVLLLIAVTGMQNAATRCSGGRRRRSSR